MMVDNPLRRHRSVSRLGHFWVVVSALGLLLGIGVDLGASFVVAVLLSAGLVASLYRHRAWIDVILVSGSLGLGGLMFFTPLRNHLLATFALPISTTYAVIFRRGQLLTRRTSWLLYAVVLYVALRFLADPTIQIQGMYGGAKFLLKVLAGIGVFLTTRYFWERSPRSVVKLIVALAGANAIAGAVLFWPHRNFYNAHYYLAVVMTSSRLFGVHVGSLVGSTFVYELLLGSAMLWFAIEAAQKGLSGLDRWKYLGMFVVFAPLFYLGGERSVLLGLMLGLLYVVYRYNRLAGIVTAGLCALGVVRFVNFGGYSAVSRLFVWQVAYSVWTSSVAKVLFGIGWGNFAGAYLPYSFFIPGQVQLGAAVVSTQNAFLDFLVTGGIVAAVLFVSLLTVGAHRLWRQPAVTKSDVMLRTWAISNLIMFVVYIQFDIVSGSYLNMAWFAFVLALCWAERTPAL